MSRIYTVGAEDRVRAGEGAATDADFIKSILETLNRLTKHCRQLDLYESEKYIASLTDRFKWQKTNNDVVGWLRGLREVIENEAGDRHVFHLAAAKSRLLTDEFPRWQKVRSAFPSADSDIVGAINCHVFGQDTASVFHCMRIAEIGLRALAKERRVKIPKKPLEWADWADILSHIKQKVDKLAMNRRGPARDAALEFYRGAMGEFEAFKDVYRNNVMHVRKSYDEDRAASVLSHVREFMNRLADKIDENRAKQIAWGLKT